MTDPRVVAISLLSGIFKTLDGILKASEGRNISKVSVKGAINTYIAVRKDLLELYPEIVRLISAPDYPVGWGLNTADSYYYHQEVEAIHSDVSIILDTITSTLSVNNLANKLGKKIFISHGRSSDWRLIQEYIEKVLHMSTLELAQEANKGRTISQKLIEESENCNYAVIIMTGDDISTNDEVRARENVVHEIGYFQGRYGYNRVCILHESGVNIPSNLHGIVYIPFPKGVIEASQGTLTRELQNI